jgi:hypothetical protein
MLIKYDKPVTSMSGDELRAKIMEIDDKMSVDEWPRSVQARLRRERDRLFEILWKL